MKMVTLKQIVKLILNKFIANFIDLFLKNLDTCLDSK